MSLPGSRLFWPAVRRAWHGVVRPRSFYPRRSEWARQRAGTLQLLRPKGMAVAVGLGGGGRRDFRAARLFATPLLHLLLALGLDLRLLPLAPLLLLFLRRTRGVPTLLVSLLGRKDVFRRTGLGRFRYCKRCYGGLQSAWPRRDSRSGIWPQGRGRRRQCRGRLGRIAGQRRRRPNRNCDRG